MHKAILYQCTTHKEIKFTAHVQCSINIKSASEQENNLLKTSVCASYVL